MIVRPVGAPLFLWKGFGLEAFEPGAEDGRRSTDFWRGVRVGAGEPKSDSYSSVVSPMSAEASG